MPSGIAAARLLAADALDLELSPDELAPDTVVAGDPVAASRGLGRHGSVEVGVWSLTPGTVTDIESDETFVVLQGAGTVAFEDGTSIDLRPGVVVRLVAGDRTTWTVHATLRKLYIG